MPTPNILIVEDNSIIALDIKGRLKSNGYDVAGIVSSGEKAIEQATEIRPDLILMDIQLRGDMDGIQAAESIQSNLGIPVVFLTANADEDKFQQAKLAIPFGYIIKPFQDREFKITIEMALYKAMMDKKRREDENENVELLQLLNQRDKMASIGRLAAGVAHEINNPVGFVTSNINSLNDYLTDIKQILDLHSRLVVSLKKTKPEKIIEKQINKIECASRDLDIKYILDDIDELMHDSKDGLDRIRQIVVDLKDFAHPGKNDPVPVDINAGINSTLNVVNNELKYKATVIKELGQTLPVMAVPQQINQVFMNILMNAAQAIEEMGEIKIKTEYSNSRNIITISDTGCGIGKENIEKIFDPFFTTKDIGKGTGLGMNIAYNIIKKFKGDIEVNSVVGEGTTFTITLPGIDDV